MKALTYVGVGLALVLAGFGLDKAGVQNWPSNVGKWWDGPPSGASELTLSIDEALKDESEWKIVVPKKSYYETKDITNGRITFTGVNGTSNYYHDDVFVNKKNVKDALSASEQVYLFNKARTIYKKLRYESAREQLTADPPPEVKED